MHFFLEALDVWLFRDGRPFNARSDHRAESIFPPYPSVVQGVIRSHHLVVKNVDLRDPQQIAATVGTAENYTSLRLRGAFLAKKEQGQVVRYLPVPAHAVPNNDGYSALVPIEPPETVKTNGRTPQLLWSTSEPRKDDFGQWLLEDQLHLFLAKSSAGQPVKAVSSSDLFERESRVGIARNDVRRTAEEGALYEVEFIRPCKDIGLLVEVEGYDGWPSAGVMRIGGEGRGACFAQVSASAWPTPPSPLPKGFLVYFATPTYFTAGWQPQDWGKFFEGEVKLQAAALNRFQSLGGFDWAKNDHKPARRYVPAGSVYFFESKGEARLKPGLTQQAITDFGPEIGFGQILIREW